MAKKNISTPFKFYCCSEDFIGIYPEIELISLPDIDLETWWWKLWINSNEFPIKGKCIMLDLDLVIQNNIQEIIEFDTGSDLYILKAQWKSDAEYNGWIKDTKTNSSITCWDNTKYEDHFFNRFMSNPEYYMSTYRGKDGYLEEEFSGSFKTLPTHWVYCRLWGYDESDPDRYQYAVDPYRTLLNISCSLYRMPDRMICLFNGIRDDRGITDDIYDGFEHYWSD